MFHVYKETRKHLRTIKFTPRPDSCWLKLESSNFLIIPHKHTQAHISMKFRWITYSYYSQQRLSYEYDEYGTFKQTR